MNKKEFVVSLCKAREKCGPSSATTHFMTIKRLYKILKNMDKKDPLTTVPKTGSWLTKRIFGKIKNLSLITQRNLVTSALVYLQWTKAPKNKQKVFSTKMYDLVKLIREDTKKNKHKLSEKQKKMWATKEELNNAYAPLLADAQEILKKRKDLNKLERRRVRDVLILSVHLGKGVPVPRLDWYSATWAKNHDGSNKTAVFRNKGRWKVAYGGKTKSTYGISTFTVGQPLAALLSKWYQKTGEIGQPVFLTDRNQPFTKGSYGDFVRRLLQKVYKRPITASFMRHLFVSHKYSNLPKILQEFAKDSLRMTHTEGVAADVYLKAPE